MPFSVGAHVVPLHQGRTPDDVDARALVAGDDVSRPLRSASNRGPGHATVHLDPGRVANGDFPGRVSPHQVPFHEGRIAGKLNSGDRISRHDVARTRARPTDRGAGVPKIHQDSDPVAQRFRTGGVRTDEIALNHG